MNGEWRRQAACRPTRHHQLDHLFIPRTVSSHNPHNWAATDAPQALEYCHTCPVTLECEAYQQRKGITFGVWGGTLVGRGPDTTGVERERDKGRKR